eukprot:4940618-Amphidinium_carterae.1
MVASGLAGLKPDKNHERPGDSKHRASSVQPNRQQCHSNALALKLSIPHLMYSTIGHPRS